MHYSTPWGKEIGFAQVALKVSTAEVFCSFHTCSAWNGAPAHHLRHSGLVAEPGAVLVPRCNTDIRGYPEGKVSPALSSQPRPRNRGLALPQHPPVLPSRPVKWDSREAKSLGM